MSVGIYERIGKSRGPYRRKSLAERFWSKVNKAGPDECWEWQASKKLTGYGQMSLDPEGRMTPNAQRISWILTYGDPGELHVLHKCNNPGCVNPNHLELGTHQENMEYKIKCGRAKGRYSQ